MVLTPQQIQTIRAIVSIFETGSIRGRYDALVVLPDGAGISYGRHQATLASGNLSRLILHYYLPHASPANQRLLDQYAGRLRHNSALLNTDERFKQLLRTLAQDDPAMRRAQDELFDEEFLRPALAFCDRIGLVYALSAATIYDSMIQGGFAHCRNATRAAIPSRGGNEQIWTHAYLLAREQYLLTRQRQIVRQTVYRPRALMQLVQTQNWHLALPITVRNIMIREEDLDDA